MYLYIFKLTFQDNSQKNYYKFCAYPKKTKLYKDCIKLLNKDIIKRFTYYVN